MISAAFGCPYEGEVPLSRVVEIAEKVMAAEPAELARMVDVNLRAPFFDDDVIRASLELANLVKLSDEELGTVAAACG